MQLHLNIRYKSGTHSCLCFRCAVLEAISGKLVYPEVDDFSDENDFRETLCGVCGRPITQDIYN